MTPLDTAEHARLRDHRAWKRWGPYLTERAWGNVREDTPDDNEPWKHVPFEHARSRAFRWSEDGLAGFCDSDQQLCMSVALWNERCQTLKERLFGLTNEEGNHGEDVKELYLFLDGVPSHAYMKALYRYPQVAFPYDKLREESANRSRDLPEYEITDALADVLAECRYFDVFVEYAKAGPEDVFCRITAVNRGPDAAPLHLLPHLWFRNSWTWDGGDKPALVLDGEVVRAEAQGIGTRWWYASNEGHKPRWLFTDNETNNELLSGKPNASRYTKDGIGEAVVHGRLGCINPARKGTRCAAHFSAVVQPGESYVVYTRLTDAAQDAPFADVEALFAQRIDEANAFYEATQRENLTDEERRVQRQAFAGLCWSQAFYHFDVDAWHGDAASKDALNQAWTHLKAGDIVSVPDKWEYPWFAAWDQVFQAVAIALIDTEFARQQIAVLVNDRFLHPDGQIPAFEGDFSLPHPPVHAWAALHAYDIERRVTGKTDLDFLRHMFHRLLLNYGWWFHPKRGERKAHFEGGFLGMDNISVFDRNEAPPGGGQLVQADSYGWMGLFTLNMLQIAVELARTDRLYEAEAVHFVNALDWLIDLLHGDSETAALLWDDEDGFFYDVLFRPERNPTPLRIRSYAGLIPFSAIDLLDGEAVAQLPKLNERLDKFAAKHDGHLRRLADGRVSLTLLERERVERLLGHIVDPDEFLSDYGLRSLSRFHLAHPFVIEAGGEHHSIGYEPGESQTDQLGGNSNWRGPVWAPINVLIIEALRKYQLHYDGELRAPDPTRRAQAVALDQIADELCRRVVGIFLPDANGCRPAYGENAYYRDDPHWRDYVLFFEHFHGEKGHGLGANHQNGWTALIAKLIQDCGAV